MLKPAGDEKTTCGAAPGTCTVNGGVPPDHAPVTLSVDKLPWPVQVNDWVTKMLILHWPCTSAPATNAQITGTTERFMAIALFV